MNKALSLVLLAALGDLPYITKKSGVVQVLQRPISGENGTIFKKIPVSTLASNEDCGSDENAAVAMVPDAGQTGILYFEDRGSGLGARRASTQQYRSDMRLICWLNTRLINQGDSDMLFTSVAMNEIINLLTSRISNSSPFININVTISRIPEASANLFSQYDYDEKRTQFLLSPYDFFALDLNISFELARYCKITPTVTPPDICD